MLGGYFWKLSSVKKITVDNYKEYDYVILPSITHINSN